MVKQMRMLQGSLLALYLVATSATSQNNNTVYYEDAKMDYQHYTIEVSNTYLKKKFFLKSLVKITNPIDHYLILDGGAITAQGDSSSPVENYSDDDIVFAPGAYFKKRLKFNRVAESQSITFRFAKAHITDRVLARFEPAEVPLIPGAITSLGRITIQVLKVTPHQHEYKVRVRIRYYGDKFLAVAFNNICAEGGATGRIYNQIRPNHRMHHKPGKYLEMASLTFPILEGERLEQMILFENVFTEFSTKPLEGFDLKYTLKEGIGTQIINSEKPEDEGE